MLRVFLIFTKQFFAFHSNRVKCEKQILPSMGFEPTTSCVHGVLQARPRGPHGREPYARWYLAGAFVEKYFQSISY